MPPKKKKPPNSQKQGATNKADVPPATFDDTENKKKDVTMRSKVAEQREEEDEFAADVLTEPTERAPEVVKKRRGKISTREFRSPEEEQKFLKLLKAAQASNLEGNLKRAKALAVQALRIKPHSDVFILLESIAEEERDFHRAGEYRLLHAFFAQDPVQWRELYQMYMQSGDLPRAVLCLKRLAALVTGRDEKHQLNIDRADLLISLGEAKAAESLYLRMWNRSDHTDFSVLQSLASLMFQRGRFAALQRIVSAALNEQKEILREEKNAKKTEQKKEEEEKAEEKERDDSDDDDDDDDDTNNETDDDDSDDDDDDEQGAEKSDDEDSNSGDEGNKKKHDADHDDGGDDNDVEASSSQQGDDKNTKKNKDRHAKKGKQQDASSKQKTKKKKKKPTNMKQKKVPGRKKRKEKTRAFNMQGYLTLINIQSELLLELARYDEAIQIVNEAVVDLELASNASLPPDLCLKLAIALALTGQTDSASAIINQLLTEVKATRTTELIDVLYDGAETLLKLGQVRYADDVYRVLQSLLLASNRKNVNNNDYSDGDEDGDDEPPQEDKDGARTAVQYGLGRCALLRGDVDEAFRVLSGVLTLTPEHCMTRLSLAEIASQMSDWARACDLVAPLANDDNMDKVRLHAAHCRYCLRAGRFVDCVTSALYIITRFKTKIDASDNESVAAGASTASRATNTSMSFLPSFARSSSVLIPAYQLTTSGGAGAGAAGGGVGATSAIASSFRAATVARASVVLARRGPLTGSSYVGSAVGASSALRRNAALDAEEAFRAEGVFRFHGATNQKKARREEREEQDSKKKQNNNNNNNNNNKKNDDVADDDDKMSHGAGSVGNLDDLQDFDEDGELLMQEVLAQGDGGGSADGAASAGGEQQQQQKVDQDGFALPEEPIPSLDEVAAGIGDEQLRDIFLAVTRGGSANTAATNRGAAAGLQQDSSADGLAADTNKTSNSHHHVSLAALLGDDDDGGDDDDDDNTSRDASQQRAARQQKQPIVATKLSEWKDIDIAIAEKRDATFHDVKLLIGEEGVFQCAQYAAEAYTALGQYDDARDILEDMTSARKRDRTKTLEMLYVPLQLGALRCAVQSNEARSQHALRIATRLLNRTEEIVGDVRDEIWSYINCIIKASTEPQQGTSIAAKTMTALLIRFYRDHQKDPSLSSSPSSVGTSSFSSSAAAAAKSHRENEQPDGDEYHDDVHHDDDDDDDASSAPARRQRRSHQRDDDDGGSVHHSRRTVATAAPSSASCSSSSASGWFCLSDKARCANIIGNSFFQRGSFEAAAVWYLRSLSAVFLEATGSSDLSRGSWNTIMLNFSRDLLPRCSDDARFLTLMISLCYLFITSNRRVPDTMVPALTARGVAFLNQFVELTHAKVLRAMSASSSSSSSSSSKAVPSSSQSGSTTVDVAAAVPLAVVVERMGGLCGSLKSSCLGAAEKLTSFEAVYNVARTLQCCGIHHLAIPLYRSLTENIQTGVDDEHQPQAEGNENDNSDLILVNKSLASIKQASAFNLAVLFGHGSGGAGAGADRAVSTEVAIDALLRGSWCADL